MSGLFNLLRWLANQYSCSLLLVHHLRKRADHAEDSLDRLRGSSDIAASVDSVLEVGGEFSNLVVRHSKSKRGPALGTFLIQSDISEQAVRFSFMDPDIKAEIDHQEVKQFLLQTLRAGPMNQSQLLAAGKKGGLGRKRLQRGWEELQQEGRLEVKPGPNKSLLYGLVELLFDPPAGGEQTAQEAKEVEFDL